MADSTNTAPTETPVIEGVVVDKKSRIGDFANKHPRAARIAAITLAVGTAVGAVLTAKTLRANKSHLDAATDHLSEAAHELSTSVTPQSPEA